MQTISVDEIYAHKYTYRATHTHAVVYMNIEYSLAPLNTLNAAMLSAGKDALARRLLWAVGHIDCYVCAFSCLWFDTHFTHFTHIPYAVCSILLA